MWFFIFVSTKVIKYSRNIEHISIVTNRKKIWTCFLFTRILLFWKTSLISSLNWIFNYWNYRWYRVLSFNLISKVWFLKLIQWRYTTNILSQQEVHLTIQRRLVSSPVWPCWAFWAVFRRKSNQEVETKSLRVLWLWFAIHIYYRRTIDLFFSNMLLTVFRSDVYRLTLM